MATITSPRAPQSPTSSVRSSLSIDRGSNNASTLPPPTTTSSTRRNRSALRDYYNLPPPTSNTNTNTTTTSTATSTPSFPQPSTDPADDDGGTTTTTTSPLDAPDFSAPDYVHHLLSTASLGDVLRTESRLLGEIRGLDGEKKALVYDNYSKLIAATDTIGRMREEMQPLTPVLGRLGGMVEGIVVAAGEIVESQGGAGEREQGKGDVEQQREVVRWVLDAPGRLRKLKESGQNEAAVSEWEEVQRMLDGWKGVGGVEEVRKQCEEAMTGG